MSMDLELGIPSPDFLALVTDAVKALHKEHEGFEVAMCKSNLWLITFAS